MKSYLPSVILLILATVFILFSLVFYIYSPFRFATDNPSLTMHVVFASGIAFFIMSVRRLQSLRNKV